MANPTNPLATESFSFRWLTLATNPIPLDKPKQHEFYFDLHFAADEIFSDGLIKTTSPVPSAMTISPISLAKNQHDVLGKWRKSSKRMLDKCLEFVWSLSKTRKNNRVDDVERKVLETQTSRDSKEEVRKSFDQWRSSAQTLRDSSPARSSSVSHDAENSIDEAILYCRRSIGIKSYHESSASYYSGEIL